MSSRRASAADLQEQLLNAEASLRAARLQEKQAKQALDDASGTTRPAGQGRPLHRADARREAQQQVDDLQSQIRYATLVAPIDGTITAVNIGAGLDSTGTRSRCRPRPTRSPPTSSRVTSAR